MPGPSKPQVKINALLRLVKEHDEYVDEEGAIRSQLLALEQAANKDEYEIRRTQQVLDETERVKRRVAQSIKEHAAEVRKLGGLKPEEERQAKQAIEAATKVQ